MNTLMAADELRIVSLDALKRQMKIDFEEDDDLIVMYGVAAGGRYNQHYPQELRRVGHGKPKKEIG
ncbi:hypothetical protein NXW84_21710 [Bacteroides fragilis]|nr:hypothetical protein NXW84_21710 [Bacteroides fragilis]